MGSYFARPDLDRLRELRQTLIGIEGRPQGTPVPRYWQSGRDLELYDQTFGQRIAWKWKAVLDELEQRGLELPSGRGVDWGCGTGVASRALLARVDPSCVAEIGLWDRDSHARRFASERIHSDWPAVAIRECSTRPSGDVDFVLLSHMLDELDAADEGELLDSLHAAGAVLWVEPGSRITSRRLSAVRDALAGDFDVLAPCSHQAACGMLAAGNERHWCHSFAKPPGEVATEGRWAEFGRELSIDLRSLPYSFLYLRRRTGSARLIDCGTRLLGRPRVQRGRALVDLCNADGVHEAVFLQRTDKALFKELRETAGEVFVFDLDLDDQRVTRIERRFATGGGVP